MRIFYSPLRLVQTTNTETVPAGFVDLYTKADTKLYKKLPTGEEIEIGGSSASGSVPTYTATNYTIADNQQALFRKPIKVDAGAKIIIGANSYLIGI